jgi:hypothetical protein
LLNNKNSLTQNLVRKFLLSFENSSIGKKIKSNESFKSVFLSMVFKIGRIQMKIFEDYQKEFFEKN